MTFDERIRQSILESEKSCNYRPTKFKEMVDDYGALDAVKKLLAYKHKITEGLTKLYLVKRLDLCFENIIFEPEWHDMFTKEELSEAKYRLKTLGVDVSKLSVEPLNNRIPTNDNEFIFNLSYEQFKDALTETEILHDNDIPLLNCFLEASEYTQSAPQLAEKLGYSDIGPVNALVGKFAKRIAEYYKVTLERESNSPDWWRVIANGKEINGTFYWTLKPALVSVLKENQAFLKKQTYWLLPCNEANYDVEKAYREYHTIDWNQTNNQIAINDIVYIYQTKPQQRVRFTCRVKNVNKKSANKKDVDCYKDSTPFENKDNYMTLEFINRFEEVFADMESLKNDGVPVVRGLMRIPEAALNHIKEIEKSDNEAKRFDGSIPADIPEDHWSLVGGDEEELKEKAEKEAKQLSDTELFEKARQQGTAKPKEKASTTSSYVRNTYVAEASKRRAKGICQLCGQPAPFNDKYGTPYLESHHIVWLSEGGEDTLENTAALCPNCHRKMHVVKDENDIKKLKSLYL